MAKYRLLVGHHSKGTIQDQTFVKYVAGDIIDTDYNLCSLNSPTGQAKFELVGEEDYHKMTLANLRKYAVERGIDLGKTKKKSDIVGIIEDFTKEVEEAA